MDLFHTLEQKLGRLNIIVEDLGFLTPSVLKLVADSGFPGMKVIQFAFDSREGSNYLPHTYTTSTCRTIIPGTVWCTPEHMTMIRCLAG